LEAVLADESSNLKKRRGGIDPAALAAASLAAAVSVIAPPGPYGPPSIAIGATILLLITSYDIDPHRSATQSLAYAAVIGLTVMLMLGFPLECVFASPENNRLDRLFAEKAGDIGHSEVPPYVTLLGWLGVTVVMFFRDRRRAR